MRKYLLITALALLALHNVRVVEAEPPTAARSPDASVAFFQSITGRQFLVGQMGAYGEGYSPEVVNNAMERFHASTGQYPAIVGMDYWRADKTLEESIAEANTVLTDWYRRGAYVTVSAHFRNPFNGGGVTDRTGNDRLRELLDPATSAGAAWRGWLDTVAAGLQQLENSGI